MKNKRKTRSSLLISLLALSTWTSCTTEDQLYSPTSSDVEAIFTLKSPTAMNGKITIHEAYLKLDRLQATGSLGGNNSTDITQDVPPEEPPYQLTKSDSGKINFRLPFRNYDRLDFHLFLFQGSYDLVFQENPVSEIPDPVEGNGSSDNDDSEENDGDNNNGSGNENTNDDQDSGSHDNDSNDSQGDDQENQDDGDDDEDDGDDDEDDGDNKKKDNKNKNKGNDDKDDDDNDRDDDDEDKDDDEDSNDDDDGEDDDDDGRSGRSEKQIVNLADFFQNAKPAMVLAGSYENNGRIISIIFVVTDVDEITIPARQDGSFALSLNQMNSAVITFDPEVLFEGITPADIESAQIQNFQQQDVVFIHQDFNTQLYQVLTPRLEQSAALNFSSDSDL